MRQIESTCITGALAWQIFPLHVTPQFPVKQKQTGDSVNTAVNVDFSSPYISHTISWRHRVKQHRATDESCHRRCHVVPDNIMLLCFLYCAQVLWENWCLYNKSCSYGNQDGYLFVEDRRICLVHTAATVDSICRCDHLPAVSLQRKDEANANITRDSFRLMTDSRRRGILWLFISKRRLTAASMGSLFIKLLNCCIPLTE